MTLAAGTTGAAGAGIGLLDIGATGIAAAGSRAGAALTVGCIGAGGKTALYGEVPEGFRV
jgi:hypothetical protein